MSVKLIAITKVVGEEIPDELKTPDGLIAYCARVSSSNQQNTSYDKLLNYCLNNGHVSIFETPYMTVEIKTTRAIAQQIIRHRSFTFQEFSQRYAKATSYSVQEARLQDSKNRQNSLQTNDEELKKWFEYVQVKNSEESFRLYNEAVDKGIAKECARFLLPLNTDTKIYMTGNARSWIHYLASRTHESTQKEHRDIALGIERIFLEQFPIVAEALK